MYRQALGWISTTNGIRASRIPATAGAVGGGAGDACESSREAREGWLLTAEMSKVQVV